jgi:mono/diheme cytochrome c family protein
MKRIVVFVAGVAAVFGLAMAQNTRPAADRQEQIQRGKYLVHSVAMCIECHTPRTSDGKLIEERLLQGAPMPVDAPFPTQRWAYRAPQIAGLPGWAFEDAVRFLETGEDHRGYRPAPPMPSYRFNRADAEAVVTYLMSLKG